METILVAYGEIALKSRRVRRRLEKMLANHIEVALRRRGFDNCRAMRRFGRIYVKGVPAEEATTVAKVFGVALAMPALRTESALKSILDLGLEVADSHIGEGQAFAVRPHVVGEHPYSSRDIAVKLGSVILEKTSNRGVHVDLSQPDVTLHVEVRDRDAFVYTQVVKGVRGLPYGSQGRLVSLFSGGIDSPVGTWLMMKRGAETLPLLLDQRPYVGESYIERAEAACKALTEFVPSTFGLYIAPIGDLMGRIMEASIHRLRCVLCKRSIYRIASIFAKECNARGIVTGESLGQVASQTLDNLYIIDSVAEVPVIRPIIGFDKIEIDRVARKIGTYDITAKTVEGCTVVPDKPATRSRMDQVLELERELDLEDLCIKAAGRISFKEMTKVPSN